MSFVHILPLHLAQMGWGSLSIEDRKVPHFRPPTPGQIRNSLDITKEKGWKILKSKRHQSTINVNKKPVADDEGQATTEREVFTQPWLSKEWQLSRGAGGWRGGGGWSLSHLLHLTTGLVINSSVTTSPTLAGERMLLIPKVSILSEQMKCSRCAKTFKIYSM